MSHQPSRGYLIVASNTDDVDYIACAETLADSLRHWHPDVKIALLTNDSTYKNALFDYVIEFPHGDQGGWANDWQVYEASPFHETIKLEADMFVSSPVDHWWTYFRNYDVWFANTVTNIHSNPVVQSPYRKIFYKNTLPEAYNAVTYWRVSRTAKEFFNTVRTFFQNWEQARLSLLGGADEPANTDLIYAMTAEYMGRERFGIPGIGPDLVHMKSQIIGTHHDDWTQELVWEVDNGVFRVNGVNQLGFVHYHHKPLGTQLL